MVAGKRYFFIFVLFALVNSSVWAGLSDRLSKGMSIVEALASEVRSGFDIVDLTRQAMRELSDRKQEVLAAALSVAPGDASRLVEIALANGVSAEEATALALRAAPKQAEEIMRTGIAANEAGAVDLLKQAMRAGVDPDLITPLINEYVLKSMQGDSSLSADERKKRMLTAEEILSTKYDETPDMASPVPAVAPPPRNSGSSRLASPN